MQHYANKEILLYPEKREEINSQEVNGTVEHQQLIAKLITRGGRGGVIYCQTQKWTGNRHPWRHLVIHPSLGEQAVGKKSQQGTISVGAEDIDGIDDTGGVEYPKQHDEEYEHQCHAKVDNLAKSYVITSSEYIDTQTRGNRRECRIGTGETCRCLPRREKWGCW